MLRKMLPHATIVLCNMYIVFFVLDHVNSAMQFIDNGITKTLLLITCVLATVNAATLIRENRRKQELLNRRRAAAAAQRRTAAPAPQRRAAAPAAARPQPVARLRSTRPE